MTTAFRVQASRGHKSSPTMKKTKTKPLLFTEMKATAEVACPPLSLSARQKYFPLVDGRAANVTVVLDPNSVRSKPLKNQEMVGVGDPETSQVKITWPSME